MVVIGLLLDASRQRPIEARRRLWRSWYAALAVLGNITKLVSFPHAALLLGEEGTVHGAFLASIPNACLAQ